MIGSDQLGAHHICRRSLNRVQQMSRGAQRCLSACTLAQVLVRLPVLWRHFPGIPEPSQDTARPLEIGTTALVRRHEGI